MTLSPSPSVSCVSTLMGSEKIGGFCCQDVKILEKIARCARYGADQRMTLKIETQSLTTRNVKTPPNDALDN